MADKEQKLAEEPTAEGELEGLKRAKEALAAELDVKNAAIAKFEKAMGDKESEVITLKQSLADTDAKLVEVSDALAQAVASYRAAVVETNPGVFAELVNGDTIDEVNDSLKNAQVLIDRVRQEIEAEDSKTKVPVGAPQRVPLDLSALSPREKIQYAVGGFSS
ncbi:hypothetical protein ACFLXD_01480 [Chloroflexota bacterium]